MECRVESNEVGLTRVQLMEPVGETRSPWQNGYAGRLIGSMRPECLDHIVVFDEAHLRRVFSAYALLQRTPDASVSRQGSAGTRPVQRLVQLAARPILGGLHHQYCRI